GALPARSGAQKNFSRRSNSTRSCSIVRSSSARAAPPCVGRRTRCSTCCPRRPAPGPAVNRRDCLGLLGGLAASCLAPGAGAQAFAEGPAASDWFERAGQLAGFTTGVGEGPPAAVVFFDARCPHCTRLWADTRRRDESARLHWVPVVLLAPASARQAAALLRADDPVAAMDAHTRSRSAGGDGISSAGEPTDEETHALKQNTATLRAMEVASVPAILHRSRDGRIGLTVGAMPAADLARLLGAH